MTNPYQMIELKPCPFCGAHGADLFQWHGKIRCRKCECRGPLPALITDQDAFEEDGRKAWNERAELENGARD